MPHSSNMTDMTKRALLLLMFALPVAISGCGNSVPPQQAVDDTSQLCPAIVGTGLARQCTVSSSDQTIHITIDSFDDNAARNACADVVNRVAKQTAHLSAQWMLQVYSPYRSDKALATCPLH